MTTLIVLPTPPATRAPAPAQGESGGDATDAGRFAALLDAAMATGTDGAPSDAATAGTPADGATPTGAALTLVPPLAEGADGGTADATDGAPSDAAAATAPVDGVSLLLASGAVVGGAVPPAAPTPAMPEPNPADASAPTVTSASASPGATAPAAPTTAGAATQPSPHPGTGAATTQGEAPADATTAQSAQTATTDQGDLTTEAARPGEVAGNGFGHAERSGAGGTPRPAAPPEASGAVQATTTPAAPVTTTDRVSATTATAATETARPVAAQVLEQLDARWPAVRSAGPGTHVMTLRLEPEHFGPLRVVAHIGAEGVRIELLGATDAARDALRQALPDLKRDLVGVGLTADLDLGSRGQNGQGVRADGGASGDASGRGDRSDQGDRPASGTRGDRPVPDGVLPTQTTATARRGRLDLTV